MARRRYLSTDISLDPKVNRLGMVYGDFAVVVYTWLIPHADDAGSVNGDPEQLLYLVAPGRRDRSIEDVEVALGGMAECGLIEWDVSERRVQFPPTAFYRHQSYIKEERRKSAQNTAIPGNAAVPAHLAENAASFPVSFPVSSSSSSSVSPSLSSGLGDVQVPEGGVGGSDAPIEATPPPPPRSVDLQVLDRFNQILVGLPGYEPDQAFLRKVGQNYGHLDLEEQAMGISSWFRARPREKCTTGRVLGWLRREVKSLNGSLAPPATAASASNGRTRIAPKPKRDWNAEYGG